jgi:threonine aldolase
VDFGFRSSIEHMIDLRSDTVTQPTPGMRRAMATAEVGDDLLDGDPTTRRLQDRVAQLVGKEAALFFPTGTMANQTAVWLHASRGTELLADPDSHLMRREVAACAALCGVQPRAVLALRADQPARSVESAVDCELTTPSPSRISLVCLENTHNGAGGLVLHPEAMRGAAQAARRYNVPVHLDGARIWNAAVASGVTPADLADMADTVTVCFDKGLGAPAGSALAGPAALIDAARPVRRRFGGTMRQSGVLGAAALYALDHHMGDLARDHEHARALAGAFDGILGLRVIAPQTNIVMIDLAPPRTAPMVAGQARAAGVLVTVWTPTRLRVVTHRDINDRDVEIAIEVLGGVLGNR